MEIRAWRRMLEIGPVYKLVDTCAAEFEAATPYYYSTYETPYTQLTTDNKQLTITEDEIRLTNRPKIIIIAAAPIASDRESNSIIAACKPPSQ